MTTTTTNKTHGRFWALLKANPEYNEKYKEEMKCSLVSYYSKDRTDSLAELYKRFPAAYEKMIQDMKWDARQGASQTKRVNPQGNVWRKRVIAAVCGWLDRTEVKFSSPAEKISYAKGVAQRAANCADFNKIPATRLQEIYNAFLKRNDTRDNIEVEGEVRSILGQFTGTITNK